MATLLKVLNNLADIKSAGGVALRVRTQAPHVGIHHLLFDAISNLVDNAIKHGRERGLVSISTDCHEEGAVLAISDDGPGVLPNETDLIFRRFYRSEKSRCTPGNGLGLSLVAAVARVHGANIKLFPNRPGLTIELQFPRSPPTHESAQI